MVQAKQLVQQLVLSKLLSLSLLMLNLLLQLTLFLLPMLYERGQELYGSSTVLAEVNRKLISNSSTIARHDR